MMTKRAIFIAGTDTSVGKTLIAGCLAAFLVEKGFRVATQKWVQTGSADDIAFHQKMIRAAQRSNEAAQPRNYKKLTTPYHFKFPASPHLSAGVEQKKINITKIIDAQKELLSLFDVLITEGTGGLMVPFTRGILAVDIIKKIRPVVVLVSANKLGSINHTLLSIEALKKRNIRIAGIVFNNPRAEHPLIIKDNPKTISRFSGGNNLGIMPYVKNTTPLNLMKAFSPIGESFIKIWKTL